MAQHTDSEPAASRLPRPSEIHTILVFAMNLLGDSVCRLPAIAAAKRAYPDARLVVVADPRYRQVFDGQPFLDEVWELDRTGGRLPQARAWLHHYGAARRARPDLVLDLYGSRRTALLSRLIGAQWRAGLHRHGRSRWYNLRPAQPLSPGGHIIQQMNAAAAPAGIAAGFRYVPVAVSEAERVAAREALARAGLTGAEGLVLLNPSARVEAKRWPAERFGQLARALAMAGGISSAIITPPGEESLSADVSAASGGTAVVLAPLGIKQLAALVQTAPIVVTGDTGVLHLANAMGTRSVILAGPTDPRLVAHPGVGHVALFHRAACADWRGEDQCAAYNECTKRRCIDAITVEEAAEAVRALLQAGLSQSPSR